MHRWLLLALLAGCLAPAPTSARTWVYHPEPDLIHEREFAYAIDGVHRQAYRFGGRIQGGVSSVLMRQDLGDPDLGWSLVSSPDGPAPRFRSRAWYDQRRNRLLVLGGYESDTTAHADLWSFDVATGTWSQPPVDPGGPASVVAEYPMTYDSRRDRLMYLDPEGPNARARVWSLDLSARPATWSSLDPDSSFRLVPLNLSSGMVAVSSAACDSLGDRLFVMIVDAYDPGLYALDLSNPTHFARVPGVNYVALLHEMAIDVPGNRLVFNSADAYDRTVGIDAPLLLTVDLADLHSSITHNTDNQPPYLKGDELERLLGWAVDPVAGTIEVPYSLGRDVRYSLDLAGVKWARKTAKNRVRAYDDIAGAVDPVGHAIYVYGGSIRAPYDQVVIADSALFRVDADDPAQQVQLDPTGERPGPLRCSAAAFDSTGRRIILFGGVDDTNTFRSDVWALDLDPEPHWSRIQTTSEGPARVSAAAALDQDSRRMYVLGGIPPDSDPQREWLWSLDLSKEPAVWTPLLGPNTRWDSVHIGHDRVHHRLIGLAHDDVFTVDLVARPPVVTYSPYPGSNGDAGYGWGIIAAFDPTRNAMFDHGGAYGSRGTGAWSGDAFYDDLANLISPLPAAFGFMVHDPVLDRLTMVNGGGLYGTWTLDLDAAVPARVDLADVAVLPQGVRIRFSGVGAESPLHVERSIDGTNEWTELGDARELSPDLFEWIDATVVPGLRYRYRARFQSNGAEQWTNVSAVVSVPGVVEFALRAAGGGVGRGWPVKLEGQVRPGLPSRVELIDVTGRVVQRRPVTGAFSVSIAPQLASAGIYFARLVQGDQSTVLRLVRF